MPLSTFLSSCLPYCIKSQPDGSTVVLNREYKPIGFMTTEFIEYADYPVNIKFKKIDPRTAAKLTVSTASVEDCIYLYNDSCNPLSSEVHMKAYTDKLAVLATLKVKDDALKFSSRKNSDDHVCSSCIEC